MKVIELVKVRIRNFQGCEDRTIITVGNTVISGRNKSGKTTAVNSVLWCLFDKDSNWQTEFDLKPKNGNADTQTEVVVTLNVDGETIELGKVYFEKWTKKRGKARPHFSGHTTEYTVNGVPKPAGEFKKEVAKICEEKLFKLLSIPGYFSEQLHWKKQREMLTVISGGVLESEIMSYDLQRIPEVLDGKSVDDRTKIIEAAQTKINKRLKDIPGRVDELTRTLVTHNIDQIEAQIAVLEKDKAKFTDDPAGKKIISDLNAKMVDIKTAVAKKNEDRLSKLREKRGKLSDKLMKVEASNIRALAERKESKERLSSLTKKSERLVMDLADLKEGIKAVTEAEWSGDTKCYVCGYPLEEKVIVEAKKKFNLKKSADIEKANDKISEMRESLGGLSKEIAKEKERIFDEVADTSTIANEIEDIEVKMLVKDDYHTDKEYTRIRAEIEAIPVTDFSEAIEAIDEQIKEKRKMVAAHEATAVSKERISELTQERTNLAIEYERLADDLFLIEKYTKKKMELIEERVNKMFTVTEFTLFETQINGGIKPICEATLDGVRYSKGQSGAEKMNTGVDIINVMSEYHGIRVFIFADNAESVNEIIPTESQLIKLVVTKDDFKVSSDE